MKKYYFLVLITFFAFQSNDSGAAGVAGAPPAEEPAGGSATPVAPELGRAIELSGIQYPGKFFTAEELSSRSSFGVAIKEMKGQLSDIAAAHENLAIIIGRGNRHPLPASMYEDGRFWVYNEIESSQNDRSAVTEYPVLPFSLESGLAGNVLRGIEFDHIMFDYSTVKFLPGTYVHGILTKYLKPGGSLVFDRANQAGSTMEYPFVIESILRDAERWVYISHFGDDFKIKQSAYKSGELIEGEEVGDNNILKVLRSKLSVWISVDQSFAAIKKYHQEKGEYPDSKKTEDPLIDLAVKHEIAPRFESCKWVEEPYPFKGADTEQEGFYLCEGFKG